MISNVTQGHRRDVVVLLSRAARSMGDGNFRPPQNPHPLNDHQKIGTGDYVGGPYGCAKFGANPVMGASGQMGKI